MAAPRRKNLLPSRRRRQEDEVAEEESVLGDFADDSLSEGSAVSNGEDGAEFEGSESSGDERHPTPDPANSTENAAGPVQPRSPVAQITVAQTSNGDAFKPSVDTKAMVHRLSQDKGPQQAEQLQFEDLPPPNVVDAVRPEVVPPKAPRNETPAQRASRDHQEYIRQRDANPAFVPNRGGFFLHDDRNNSSTPSTARPFGRGRGHGYGPSQNAR